MKLLTCSSYVPFLGKLKDVFSNEWSYEFISLVTVGEVTLKPVKYFVDCLNPSWPMPQVLRPNKATDFIDYELRHLLFVQASIAVFCNFQVFSPALLVRCGQEILFTASGAMAQFTCLVGKGRVHYSPRQLFPNWLFSGDGSGANLSLGYELSSLPVCSMGTLYTLYWFCSGIDQLCFLASQLEL